MRRQFQGGLGIQTSYTLSRSKDDGSGIFNFSRIGNVGRNTVRGPSAYNVDMSFVRRIAITRGANLNFRLEAFNVLNHTNFQLDPAGATTALPVQVVNRQAQFVAPNFGLITAALPARRLQLVLRLDF